MLDDELRHRVRRIATGERRTDDLDRIFLGLRERSHGLDSVREVGDFVAHRAQREKGLLTRQARDVFLSFQNFVHIGSGGEFTLEEIRKVAQANLRTATVEQLKRNTGLDRQTARAVLEQALRKLEREDAKEPTRRERRVVDYLGGAFIWNPAFTDVALMRDLSEVLRRNDLLKREDAGAFKAAQDFLALHVISIMHGSAVLLEDGRKAELTAGFDNDQGFLEVKAALEFEIRGKRARMPFCLFWTGLDPSAHCAQTLLDRKKRWDRPLELADGGLAPIP